MTETQKGFQLSFENGGYWEYYKDLERQFQSYLHHVPYVNGNECTYSYRLLNLILSAGGYIDSAFKEMARYSEYSKDEDCIEILKLAKKKRGVFSSSVKAFDKRYSITKKSVIFKCIPERQTIIPFSLSLKWWDFYNDVKHEVSLNLQDANLKNVRDALAGAFLLNVVHIPSALRLYDYAILKTRIPLAGTVERYGGVSSHKHLIERCLKENRRFTGDVSTPLFKYDYDQ
jgi:hypothetical protein